MNTPLRRLLTCLVAFLLSFLVGVIGVAQNEWFGNSDLTPYAFYCIPFSAILYAVSSLFYQLARTWSPKVALPTVFLIGAITGLLSTFLVLILLGSWFGAMSVPILKSWCVSAIIFIPSLYLIRKDENPKRSLIGGALVLGLGALCFWGAPLWSFASGNQHLMSAFFRYTPGEDDLQILRTPDWLSAEDHDLIMNCGLTGTLECFHSGGSNTTEWPRAKAFIIFTNSLSKTTRLPQPKHTSVLYIQREQEFEKVPADTPTFNRAIEFYHDGRSWSFSVEEASGGRSGAELGLSR